MPEQEVTVTNWPSDPLDVTHRFDDDSEWPLSISFADSPAHVIVGTDPKDVPQVDLNMTVKNNEPIPLCFTLCEPICARSDYSIGFTIFDNPLARIRIVGETRVEACAEDRPPTSGNPDCVDFTSMQPGTKLDKSFKHDDALVELDQGTIITSAGDATGILVPPGGLVIAFGRPMTDVEVTAVSRSEATVEGRNGDSLVTTVSISPSASVATISVPAIELTSVALRGDDILLLKVCGRPAGERERIF